MKKCNALISVLFLAVIFALPVITLGRRLSAVRKDPAFAQEAFSEQNHQTPEPPEQGGFCLLHQSMKEDLTGFTDTLFLKKQLISFNIEATSLLTGGTYFESTQVILGKEGWLFYKADTPAEHPIQDYTGANRYTEEELAQIASNLKETQDYFLDEWNTPLYVVSIPNKELLYSEYMPETIFRLNTQSREAQLAEYMAERPEISYFSLKGALIDAKAEPLPLYYKTDTHWTLFGAYVGLQEIFEQVYGNGIPADSSCFHVESENVFGDLARITGVPERFEGDITYVPNSDFADPAQYHDQTLLIIGDSFGDALSTISKPYYNQVYYAHYASFEAGAMSYYQPDLVIWECVERYSDNLKGRRLMDQ